MASDSRWNVRRGLNRAFAVFAICWYIAAALILWPQWLTAIKAQRGLAKTDAIIAKYGGKPVNSIPSPPAGYESYVPIPPPPAGYTVIHPDPSLDYDALAKQVGAISSTPAPNPHLPPGYVLDQPNQELPLVDAFMAQRHARDFRPVNRTIAFLLVPPVLYAFLAAIFWIVRGFRADPIKAA